MCEERRSCDINNNTDKSEAESVKGEGIRESGCVVVESHSC